MDQSGSRRAIRCERRHRGRRRGEDREGMRGCLLLAGGGDIPHGNELYAPPKPGDEGGRDAPAPLCSQCLKPRSRPSANQLAVCRQGIFEMLCAEWYTSVDSRRLSTVDLKSKAFLAVDYGATTTTTTTKPKTLKP
eukprot:1181564-Prorocentrum_minimum.AAC.2